MKQLIVFFMLVSGTVSAQWINKTSGNDFDGRFRRSYVESKSGDSIFILEEDPEDYPNPFMEIFLGYVCDDETSIQIALTVNGQVYVYDFLGHAIRGSKSYLIGTMWDGNFGKHFKIATKMSVRVHQQHCEITDKVFNMAGSAAAVKFVTRK